MIKPPATIVARPEPFARSRSLAIRTLGSMAGLLLTLSVVTVAALFYIAYELNQSAARQSQRLVNNLWQSHQAGLVSNLKDYAFWGDAYRHLHIEVDKDWAYTRNNLGASLYSDFQLEGVFVVDAHDQTAYAVEKGKLTTTQLRDWLDGDPGPLIEQVRNGGDDAVVTRVRQIRRTPVLLLAAPLTTGGDEAVEPTAPPQSVLVLAYALTPEKLLDLGRRYDVDGLREPESAEDAAQFPSTEVSAGLLLRWNPERPGNKLISGLLPVLLIFLLTLAYLARREAKRALANAERMDRQLELFTLNQTALAASEERFRNVAETASDWVWETDAQLRITYLSERFTRVTGHACQPWIGRNLAQLLSCASQPLSEWVREEHSEDARAVLRCTHYSVQGTLRTSAIAARPIRISDQTVGYLGIATDITREVETQARLLHLSQHDALTGLPNRTQLQAFINRHLETGSQDAANLTMLSLDLDSFKPINDVFGHATGDGVLREAAERLSRCLPTGGLLARQGGDEFIMVAVTLDSPEQIDQLCLRLIELMGRPFSVNNQEVVIGLSIGVAQYPQHAGDNQNLIRYSDLALYEAKKQGGNTWRLYEQDMTVRITKRRELEKSLRLAIRNEEFTLHYQPRYNIQSGEITGAEALIRWEHPTLGLCMPDTFIGLAEENGLILSLSDWVLHRACNDASSWPEQIRVSVNISALEFRTPGLVERVRHVLNATGLASDRLELEVTERVMIDDAQAALKLMLELKALGIRLSMDDFGTGYSSLSYLRMFPFDALKIDRSFINELDKNTQSQSIVHAIIHLGRCLSMSITAEGVETVQQLDCLHALACDEAQGYYLNRPMPLASFNDAVKAQDLPLRATWQL